jgi:hypothetical protein
MLNDQTLKNFNPTNITKEFIEKQVEKIDHIPEQREVARLLKKEVIGEKMFIDGLGEEIISGTDGVLWKAPNKSLNSATRKLRDEKKWKVPELNDLARNSIIIEKGGINQILEKFKELTKRTPKRDSLVAEGSYKFFKPEENAGYTGHKYNIKTPDGRLAEMQVLTPEMAYGKAEPNTHIENLLGKAKMEEIRKASGVEPGLGHIFYEKMRVIPEAERYIYPTFRELERQSIEYYAKLSAVEK